VETLARSAAGAGCIGRVPPFMSGIPFMLASAFCMTSSTASAIDIRMRSI
jgi:hypothetical protein